MAIHHTIINHYDQFIKAIGNSTLRTITNDSSINWERNQIYS